MGEFGIGENFNKKPSDFPTEAQYHAYMDGKSDRAAQIGRVILIGFAIAFVMAILGVGPFNIEPSY